MKNYLEQQKRTRRKTVNRRIELPPGTDRMQAGPQIQMDRHTITIPSVWYNENVAAFWAKYGFSFDRCTTSWTRSAKQPLNGKTYSAKTWLTSTRIQFFSFWPQLDTDRECQSCHETFTPKVQNQMLCDGCLDIVQIDEST